jgi:RsiW-degrading membrane proteinase PrsW (M82 family)
VEEFCKFFIVRWILYPNKNFNEPLDGIVYSVMVGLGFASLENLIYVFRFGIDSGILRMFSAVPAHAVFAVIMGYYIGIARFSHRHEFWYSIVALISAVLLHGSYDYFLFLSSIPGMWTGALLSLAGASWMAFRSIRLHQNASPFINKPEKQQTGG